VFDERRYFVGGREAGLPPVVFDAGGKRFGVLICEDAWFDEPAAAAVAAGAQVLCVLNASPFHLDKAGEREARMTERAQTVGVPLLYAHLVGGQDRSLRRCVVRSRRSRPHRGARPQLRDRPERVEIERGTPRASVTTCRA
jgi:NAD+ synthase (glutamine-hydrolysing)